MCILPGLPLFADDSNTLGVDSFSVMKERNDKLKEHLQEAYEMNSSFEEGVNSFYAKNPEFKEDVDNQELLIRSLNAEELYTEDLVSKEYVSEDGHTNSVHSNSVTW